MKVSDVLREAEKRLVFRDSLSVKDRCVHICHALDLLGSDGERAKTFLRSLGMGTGVRVFGEPSPWNQSKEQMAQRHAWLLFAADLADEWGVE